MKELLFLGGHVSTCCLVLRNLQESDNEQRVLLSIHTENFLSGVVDTWISGGMVPKL